MIAVFPYQIFIFELSITLSSSCVRLLDGRRWFGDDCCRHGCGITVVIISRSPTTFLSNDNTEPRESVKIESYFKL